MLTENVSLLFTEFISSLWSFPGGTQAASSPEAAARTAAAQQGGSGAQGQAEPGEINTTSNPYETLPREGEDWAVDDW